MGFRCGLAACMLILCGRAWAGPDEQAALKARIAALEAELADARAKLAEMDAAASAESAAVEAEATGGEAAGEAEAAGDVEAEAEPVAEEIVSQPEPGSGPSRKQRLPKFLTGWKANVELGLNGSEGNASRQSLRFVFNANRSVEGMQTSVNSTYRLTSQEGVRSQNQWILDARNDWLDGGSLQYFAKGTFELDEFQSWDCRVSGFGGLGYEFIKNDRTELVGRGGFGGSQRVGDEQDDFNAEGFLAADLSFRIDAKQKLQANVEYVPDTSEWSEYRLNTNASWELRIDPESAMYLRVGVANRYDSNSASAEPNDLDYFVNLGWSF